MKLFLNIMLQTLSSIKLLGQTWVNCSCQQQCSTAGWFSSFLLFEEHNRIGSDQAIYWSSTLLDELFNLVAFINLRNLVIVFALFSFKDYHLLHCKIGVDMCGQICCSSF